MDKKMAVSTLKVLSALTMLIGAYGVYIGIVDKQTIPLFTLDVPYWVLGASTLYMGMRYWRRIPDMQKSITLSSGFSWSNLIPFKSK